MVKVSIIAVGKLKEKYLKDGINEYAKRLSGFCTIEMIEVDDEEAPANLSVAQEEQIKKKECQKILKRIKSGAVVVALDIKGQKFNSEKFASKLDSFFVSGNSHIAFIIGGSLGLHNEILEAAHLRFSFSDLTFPHQLVRLMLVEQIYRAFKILGGEPYHK